MNPPIVRLFVLVVVLFAILVAYTSRWTVFEAQALRDHELNRRALLQEERIERGVVRAADGTVIAESEPLEGGRFRRTYPTDSLFSQPVGYAFTELSRTGLERSYNDQLTGREDEITSVFNQLLGQDRVGKELRTHLDPDGQQAAFAALGDRRGAVVVLGVDTGAVHVMASNPSYDPNDLDRGNRFRRLNRDEGTPLLNRTTQSGYPPGSAMKVVTAAAALDSGRFSPTSTVDGSNGRVISGVPLNNFGGQDFGQVDLTTALTQSVNTAWAGVAETLGRGTLEEYMGRFGFDEDPPLDYPDGQMIPSGVPAGQPFDVGRVGIGQGNLLVTPLQMATVSQTIGNGGVRLEPRLFERVVDSEGRVDEQFDPERAERVMSRETATSLADMMRNVVSEGTGTAAALAGVDVAGKTGTAEIDIPRRINHAWFICFTDEYAVAVVLERLTAGAGGTDAAPVARQVLEAMGG
jgi:penicillin-binding protein A